MQYRIIRIVKEFFYGIGVGKGRKKGSFREKGREREKKDMFMVRSGYINLVIVFGFLVEKQYGLLGEI